MVKHHLHVCPGGWPNAEDRVGSVGGGGAAARLHGDGGGAVRRAARGRHLHPPPRRHLVRSLGLHSLQQQRDHGAKVSPCHVAC